jgi:hypothetical protein
MSAELVIPAQAGIQEARGARSLGRPLRGDDGRREFP